MNTVTKYGVAVAMLCLSAAAFGQTTSSSAVSPIKIEGRDHYPHGYNKDNTTLGTTASGEAKDTVMVGSTMHYYVAPDPDYNAAYAAAATTDATKISETALTNSFFDWKAVQSGSATLAGATITGENPNVGYTFSKSGNLYGQSSPHVTVNWTSVGEADLTVTEHPTKYLTSPLFEEISCSSTSGKTTPVVVINAPSVMFTAATDNRTDKRSEVTCNAVAELEFAVEKATAGSGSKISESGEVDVYFTITRNGSVYAPTNAAYAGISDSYVARVSGGKFKIGLNVSQQTPAAGVYVVTLKGISDRISCKCLMGTEGTSSTKKADGILPTLAAALDSKGLGESVFTYTVATAPATGDMYHVPNKF